METRAVAGEISHAGLAGLHAQPEVAAGRCRNRAPLDQRLPYREYRAAARPEAPLGTGDGALHGGRRSERSSDAAAAQRLRIARNGVSSRPADAFAAGVSLGRPSSFT